MMSAMDVQRRLEVALAEAGAPAPVATELHAVLERHYSEAHRAYHTMEHVRACLGWLDRYRIEAERPAEIELALWFHDVIYDPTRGDNEARSAEFATTWMRTLSVPADVIDRVAQLVMSTQAHRATSGDAALLSSIDLAILGSEEEEYARFEQAVRREYAQVSQDAYRQERARVLSGFLERTVIFAHEPIAEALEAQARTNLSSALAGLQRQ